MTVRASRLIVKPHVAGLERREFCRELFQIAFERLSSFAPEFLFSTTLKFSCNVACIRRIHRGVMIMRFCKSEPGANEWRRPGVFLSNAVDLPWRDGDRYWIKVPSSSCR